MKASRFALLMAIAGWFAGFVTRGFVAWVWLWWRTGEVVIHLWVTLAILLPLHALLFIILIREFRNVKPPQ